MSTSRNDKLRMVQVGCGGRAQAHMQWAKHCGAIDLVAICDIDEKKLHESGQKFGVTKLYRDMAEMIQKEKPELVDIVTPPMIRVAIVEPAIKAGAKAILIEKPIALTPSEARRLVELGRDCLIAVNTQYQWMPHFQRFWPMLQERKLGEIRAIRASTRANILEQGPHQLDLALKAARLSGLPNPEWVLAAACGQEHYGKTPIPADVSATVGLGAARLFINHGPSAPDVPGEKEYYFQQQCEIIGDKGKLWVSLNQGWTLWTEGKIESGTTHFYPDDDRESQSLLFKHLRDAIHGGKQNEFPTRIEVAAQVSNVLFGCYASAQGGGRVKLPCEFEDSIVSKVESLPK